ncbi:hypothetical protein TSUD_211190, partial [Trifolium subterraneum]
IGQSHPTGLTSNLLKLFEPRPPLEYKPPPEKRKCPPLTGMAQFVSKFAEPGEPEYSPPVPVVETPAERRARVHKLRLEKGAAKAAEELEKYDPHTDPNISGDPYKTLFVARLSYETTESRIKREFESYGAIKRVGSLGVFSCKFNILIHIPGNGYSSRYTSLVMVDHLDIHPWLLKPNQLLREDVMVRLVTDTESNKPRGYAFIEYLHTRDMKAAYKQADGRKIEGRRVLVDVERGRTVPNWRPRRLGGGLGSNSSQDLLVPKNQECGRIGMLIGTEKSHVKEVRKEIENGSDHGNDLAISLGIVIIERIDTTEIGTGIGIGTGTEVRRGKETEIADVIEREDAIVIVVGNVIVIERGIMIGTGADYDHVESKHEKEPHGEKERDYEPEDHRGRYNQSGHGKRHADTEHDPDHYDHYEHQRGRGQYDEGDDHGDYNQYPDHGKMEDDHHTERPKSKSRDRDRNRDKDHDYHRSERSHSREYDY